MSKKKKKTKRYKINKKQKKKSDNVKSTFVDANVFLDAILYESSRGLGFFSSFKAPNKVIITSTHAMGEVVRRIYRLAQEESGNSEYDINKTIMALKSLLDAINIKIENFGDKTSELTNNVMDEDTRIKFKDALHVALAYELTCSHFCTLDEGISKGTLKKFGMSLVEI